MTDNKTSTEHRVAVTSWHDGSVGVDIYTFPSQPYQHVACGFVRFFLHSGTAGAEERAFLSIPVDNVVNIYNPDDGWWDREAEAAAFTFEPTSVKVEPIPSRDAEPVTSQDANDREQRIQLIINDWVTGVEGANNAVADIQTILDEVRR